MEISNVKFINVSSEIKNYYFAHLAPRTIETVQKLHALTTHYAGSYSVLNISGDTFFLNSLKDLKIEYN